MLEHHRDAERPCRDRIRDAHRLALPLDLARIGLHGAVDDLHERALAGAVLAQHRMDLALGQLEADAVERDHRGVALDDAVQPQQAFHGRSVMAYGDRIAPRG